MRSNACSSAGTATGGVRLRAGFSIVGLAFAVGLPTAAADGAEAPAASAATASAEQPLPGLDAVLPGLRKGGLVIYFRHGATEQTGATNDAADLADCTTQRNLSAEGRQQATLIGTAFRALRIPVSSVTTSPFCRCKDMGRLAFGRFTADNDLYFAMNTGAEETKRLADALRQRLSTPPAVGTNAVIVAHSANLREAVGLWPKPEGVAYVFRPLHAGRFEVVAKILPQDWSKAARLD
jgi:phosphohistidine phosphatase SixA